jgi:hypothetical protein
LKLFNHDFNLLDDKKYLEFLVVLFNLLERPKIDSPEAEKAIKDLMKKKAALSALGSFSGGVRVNKRKFGDDDGNGTDNRRQDGDGNGRQGDGNRQQDGEQDDDGNRQQDGEQDDDGNRQQDGEQDDDGNRQQDGEQDGEQDDDGNRQQDSSGDRTAIEKAGYTFLNRHTV